MVTSWMVLRAGAAAAVCACVGTVNGAIFVRLVETEPGGITWVTELNALTAATGFGALNAAERVQLQNRIINTLAGAYNDPGFGWAIGWGGPNPAVEQIFFTRAPAAGDSQYGDADGIDWRNRRNNDTARVYLQNFAGVLNAIDAVPGLPRAVKIDMLGVAIGMTSAHELGHNLGLRHRDCYGTELITNANWGNTGGWQKRHIMASGATGLGDNLDRTTVRYFNEYELAKLGYAAGLVAAPPASRDEGVAGDAGNNAAGATLINWAAVVSSPLLTANMIGSLPAGDEDWFWFDAPGGTRLTADVFADDIGLAGNPDLKITLHQLMPGGGIAPLFSNQVHRFLDNDVYFVPAGGPPLPQGELSLDPFILNYVLPFTNRYFLQVEHVAGGRDYEFFVTIPAPGTAALFGLGFVLAARRRR